MNKKAGERVLSIYLFIIYIMVGVGIVSGVIIFYGSPLDVRELEAGILNDKVIDCLVRQGELNGEVLKEDFDLIDFCKFDFRDNTEKCDGEEQYGVLIKLYDFDSSEKLREDIKVGRKDFLEYCNAEGKKIPKCNTDAVYVLNNGEGVIIQITSSVGKN